MSTSDLSDNCLGYLEENYILAQTDLQVFQEVINQDPRFPDFQTFAAYLKEKNYLRIPVEQTSLLYLKTIDLPNLGTIYRFKLTQRVAGKDHIRFVLAKESLDGGSRTLLIRGYRTILDGIFNNQFDNLIHL